jgi:hypothetical protein
VSVGTAFFFAITLLCIFSSVGLSFLKISVKRQRRIYWRCVAIGAVSAFLCGYPDVSRAIGMTGFFVVGMIFSTMRGTPYLKIRGKIYAFSATDRRAADDDVPETFGENLAAVADILQRRFGDDEVPDITGRNITEAFDALHRRFGNDDTEESATDATSPSPAMPHRTAPPARITVPGRGVILPRLANFLLGLPLIVGGALMAFNPPPPGHRSLHTVPTLGVFCAASGIYFAVKALRAQQTADTEFQPTLTALSARPHRHAAATPPRESAKMAATYLAAFALGGGLLWWGISAKLLSVVGMGVALLAPILVILVISAAQGAGALRRGNRAS